METGLEFKVGMFGLKYGYFLLMKENPIENIVTWTLDYSRYSDLDDNVGHWQVITLELNNNSCSCAYCLFL